MNKCVVQSICSLQNCNILTFAISHWTPTLLSNAHDMSHVFINISITIIVVSIIIVPISHIITFTSDHWPGCQDYYHLHQRQPCYRPGVQPMSSCDAGSPGPVFAVDHFLPHFIIIIIITRPWPAFGRQGLRPAGPRWIVGTVQF